MKTSQATRLKQRRKGQPHIPFEATRTRTGQPQHFKAWKQKAEQESLVRTHLSRIKLVDVARSLEEADETTAAVFHLVAKESPLVTVWELATADIKVLREIPKMGPNTLRLIYVYLTANNVPVKWVMS